MVKKYLIAIFLLNNLNALGSGKHDPSKPEHDKTFTLVRGLDEEIRNSYSFTPGRSDTSRPTSSGTFVTIGERPGDYDYGNISIHHPWGIFRYRCNETTEAKKTLVDVLKKHRLLIKPATEREYALATISCCCRAKKMPYTPRPEINVLQASREEVEENERITVANQADWYDRLTKYEHLSKK